MVNDARNALRLTSRRYDAIVSQPSHPWTAGASHLFTREFARVAKSHLSEGGVFVQWISNHFLTDSLLRSLAATLLAEFRHVRLYRPSFDDLWFLASDAPLDLEQELARSGRPLRDEPEHFHRLGISSVEDLVASLVADHEGLTRYAASFPPITDDQNRMATHSRGGGGLAGSEVDALFAADDPLLDPASWLHRELGGTLQFPHLARRLIRRHKTERARALVRVLPAGAARQLALAELQAEAGEGRRALGSARAATRADPEDAQARYFVFRQQLGSPDAQLALQGVTGSAQAVGRGWQLLQERSWSELAALDEALSLSRVTDLWYPDAALLRARWRSQPGPDRERLTREALRIVDSAWLLARDFRLHLERLWIALQLGDEDVLVESALAVVDILLARREASESASAPPDPASRAVMQQQLRGVIRALDRDFGPEARDRAGRVSEAARNLLQRIDAEAATGGARRLP